MLFNNVSAELITQPHAAPAHARTPTHARRHMRAGKSSLGVDKENIGGMGTHILRHNVTYHDWEDGPQSKECVQARDLNDNGDVHDTANIELWGRC
jgi:hypothetical protein